jgi:uncharacterized protein (DUF302 family)
VGVPARSSATAINEGQRGWFVVGSATGSIRSNRRPGRYDDQRRTDRESPGRALATHSISDVTFSHALGTAKRSMICANENGGGRCSSSGPVTNSAAGPAHDDAVRMSGRRTTTSGHDFEQTVARLDAELARRGLGPMARIDHAAGARSVGLEMPPTLVVLFGGPRAGTPLMLEAPDLALDLPLRLLVRERAGRVELVHTDPAMTVEQHGLPAAAAAPLAETVASVVAAVAAP